MRDRAKHLMELLRRQSEEPAAMTLATEPEALDLDATEFLNPEPGALTTLVLAPDHHGRQLIVERVRDDNRCLPTGHWRVRAEVLCWSVGVRVLGKTLAEYPRRLWPDPVGRIAERYVQFGARQECLDIVRFPRATLAAEFVAELRAALGEHGAGARFSTTLLAETISGQRYRWQLTRQETPEPLREEAGKSRWARWRMPRREGGEA